MNMMIRLYVGCTRARRLHDSRSMLYCARAARYRDLIVCTMRREKGVAIVWNFGRFGHKVVYRESKN